MKKSIKVRAETLKKAREKFETELPQGAFILKKNEYDASESETRMYGGESVDEAIENAKAELPAPFFVKGNVVPVIKEGTNLFIPVNVKAETEWSAETRVKTYIEDKYFYNTGYEAKRASYTVKNVELLKQGFKGVFGIGKTENTYQATVYINAWLTLNYNTWAVIEAEITDDKSYAERKMLQYAKDSDTENFMNILSQNVDVNCCDKDGRNALFHFCDNHKYSKLLVKSKIDFRKTDNFGDNILN